MSQIWPALDVKRLLRPGTAGIKIGPFGSALKLSDLSDAGAPVFGQENVIENSFHNVRRFVGPKKLKELGEYQVGPGDVLVTMMGTAGRCAAVPADARPGIMDSHLLRLRFQDNVDPRFAVWALGESQSVRDQFMVLGRGSIMHGLNSTIVKSIRIAVPDRPEQAAIADFLDKKTAAIDALIAKKERLIELLQEKRQAVITQAVTRGLDPGVPMKDSGIEWLGEIPAHWQLRRLKHISPHQSVGVVVNPSTYVHDEGTVPFFYGADVCEFRLDATTARRITEKSNGDLSKSRLRAGDLITVRVGEPGITAVVPPELDGSNCASVMFVRQGANFRSAWLAYALNSRLGRFQVEQVQYGAAQKQFNIAHAVNWVFPVPPLREQEIIVAELDCTRLRMDGLCTSVTSLIEKLREYRQALISAAVTGKLDVTKDLDRSAPVEAQ